MLRLRLSGERDWKHKAAGFTPAYSTTAAIVFLVGCLYPLIASFVPPAQPQERDGEGERSTAAVPWFTYLAFSWAMVVFGGVWYAGFRAYATWRRRYWHEERRIERVPEFERDPPVEGPLVQIHETVYLDWTANEAGRDTRSESSRRTSHETF